jgi:hypothetical protein
MMVDRTSKCALKGFIKMYFFKNRTLFESV